MEALDRAAAEMGCISRQDSSEHWRVKHGDRGESVIKVYHLVTRAVVRAFPSAKQ